jgi:hypothetical protein
LRIGCGDDGQRSSLAPCSFRMMPFNSST